MWAQTNVSVTTINLRHVCWTLLHKLLLLRVCGWSWCCDTLGPDADLPAGIHCSSPCHLFCTLCVSPSLDLPRVQRLCKCMHGPHYLWEALVALFLWVPFALGLSWAYSSEVSLVDLLNKLLCTFLTARKLLRFMHWDKHLVDMRGPPSLISSHVFWILVTGLISDRWPSQLTMLSWYELLGVVFSLFLI